MRFLKVILNIIFQKLVSSSLMLLAAGVLYEKVFLQISQKAQENTFARVSILINLSLQLY